MSPTNLTRRSFMKASALAAGAAALGSGVATVNNLVESDQAYAADEVKLVHTSCRACISNCGIIAHVQNGRVIKLEGDPADPMSEGRVCPKGLSGIQALYHPNRNKYPMKRVGERGGNQWERISWEEAIDTIADALMDMKDKTGLEGLLCSTGGGGNPQFFSPARFLSVWGGGNFFEPGCAQCYLPRNYTMPLINGVSDTSIADSGCAELYNPTVSIDTYVMWGTGPAQHAPSSAGRAVVELRAAGTKTVVIDPRYTPDAARADVWLPVRPGTDVAMMLGWTRYIIDKKLYNEEFCSKWTNLPFLVDPSDPAGALLRASKVFADVTAENEGYVYYDEKTGEVTKAFALGPDNEASYNPALFGAYDVTLADGTAIKAKTAFEAYKEQSDEFTIDHVAEVCMVDASDLEEAIKLYAECESGGISLGVATDQYPQSTQAAIGAAALDCMMGYIDKPGSPANSLPRSAESTVFPTGFFGDSPYQFIPTILNAILTGEPYQPHIWIERSGNKMAMLGNAASWVDAFPKLDLIVHMYMYPTSFSTEAADLLLPTAEWLETAFIQGRLYAVLLRQPVTNLFECIDETFIWSMLAKALAERGHEGMQKSFDQDACGPAPAYWDSMEDYYEWVASNVNMTWDELVAKAPYNAVEPEEYWNAPYEQAYRGLSSDGSSYIGFAGCAARDIKDNPLKCGSLRRVPAHALLPRSGRSSGIRQRLPARAHRGPHPLLPPRHAAQQPLHPRDLPRAGGVDQPRVRRGARHCHRRLGEREVAPHRRFGRVLEPQDRPRADRRGSEPGQGRHLRRSPRHRGHRKRQRLHGTLLEPRVLGRGPGPAQELDAVQHERAHQEHGLLQPRVRHVYPARHQREGREGVAPRRRVARADRLRALVAATV